ncbi:MAG: CRTAC1 family protein [Phycisphaerales bacterium]|nr:CRTAC1 family protein [Phycisphaerales bacterium]
MNTDRGYTGRAALALLAVSGLAAGASGQTVQFSEQTAAAGLSSTHFWDPVDVPASYMDAGMAVGDFNGDGWMDLFVLAGGAIPDRLFINNHDGTFSDQAAAWGVAKRHIGGGAVVADYNKDGRDDIYVTSYGDNGTGGRTGQHMLYRNNGDGTFTDVAASCGVNWGSATTPDAFSAAWGDYDLDGDLDLCVGCWIDHLNGMRLYRNEGDGTFTNVTGIAITFAPPTYGFSPRFIDMDGDRYPELLQTGDFGTSKYFKNNRDGTFTDVTASAGCNKESNGMGQTVADFDHDGMLDWYVTSIHYPEFFSVYPGNMLYMNQGNHVYTEVGIASGVMPGGWGWGTTAVDVNNDGWTDIAETNGWGNPPWMFVGSKLFLNKGDGTFDQLAPDCGITHIGDGRALVRLDYDNDGDQDIVIASNNLPLRFYRNDLIHDASTNWIRIFLDTSRTPTMPGRGIGSKIRATTTAFTQTGHIDGGANYLSSGEQSAFFGLGAAASADLRVEWTNGRTTTVPAAAAGQTLTITFCPADLNDDLQVDFADYLEFLNLYDAQDPFADLNGDGNVDFSDYLEFLNAYDAGC